MRSKIRRPFQKWRMAYVSRPIETVDNEASDRALRTAWFEKGDFKIGI